MTIANFAGSTAPTPPPLSFFKDKAYRMFVLRSALAPRVAWRWARFIGRFHSDLGAATAPSRVLLKPLRSYMFRRLGPRGRLRLMMEHYGLAEGVFARDTLRRICNGERVVLARPHGRKNSRYVVSLAASVVASTQREGELVICLQREGDNVRLSRLSFSFVRARGGLAVVIAGLQGPNGGHKREVIDATRELYGLRPKDVTLLAARALARALGASELHAVADIDHVLHRHQDIAKLSNYDAYWLERGAKSGGPFGFEFLALEDAAPSSNAREIAKAEIIAAVAGFVGAQKPRERERASSIAA